VPSGYEEMRTLTEQSVTVDRRCSSTNASQSLADVKLVSSCQPSASISSVSHVNSVNMSSSSSQTSDAASFVVPLPVGYQHQTQTSLAASSSMVTNVLYGHHAQTGQPLLDIASCSSHPMLPNQPLPFKVISSACF